MFRRLAREYAKREQNQWEQFPKPTPEIGLSPNSSPKYSELFLYHPIELAGLLEAAWEARLPRFRPETTRGSVVAGLPEHLLNHIAVARPYYHDDRNYTNVYLQNEVFDHLIYAYMIENTKIYEIFRRVLYEYLHGERLEVPSPETQRWLRTTEELFYSDYPPLFAFRLMSYIRPDIRASRRNAYYRMFGMDLTHGTDDGRPYSYEKPAAANRDFVKTFEEFLREVWRGIINFTNISGPNTTDDSAITSLAARLADMLNIRRRNGNLSREEFFFIATMSWFHLTVEFDSPVVKDLKAEGTNEAERLTKIGQRVGLPAHEKSPDFFSLADPMSRVLIAIESEIFSDAANVPLLYSRNSPLRNDLAEIITDWSSATGRNVKAEPVVASPTKTLPPASPPPPVAPVSATTPVPVSSR